LFPENILRDKQKSCIRENVITTYA